VGSWTFIATFYDRDRWAATAVFGNRRQLRASNARPRGHEFKFSALPAQRGG
jgi:hypothetical protein